MFLLVLLFCQRLISAPASANEVPPLEDSSGNPAASPQGLVVYSSREGADEASRVGIRLCGMGIQTAAVADVRGLNFWPAEGFVRGTVIAQEGCDRTRILLDWTGSWGNSLGIPAGGCTVLKTDGENITMLSSCASVLEGHVVIK